MDKNQSPNGLINNNYSPAVVTLNSPASPSPTLPKGAGRVVGIRKSPLIDISRYSQRLLKSPDSKELLIINSKMDIKAPQALLLHPAAPAAFGGGGAGDFQKMYDNLSPQEKESIFKYIKQEIDSINGK